MKKAKQSTKQADSQKVKTKKQDVSNDNEQISFGEVVSRLVRVPPVIKK